MALSRIGIIQLVNGQPANRNNTCISGYDSNKPNYALSNFENNNGKGYTFIDPDIGKVHLPTAEHYLHFQKLSPQGKKNHLNDFTNTKSPIDVLRGIRNYPDSDQKFKLSPTVFDDAGWDAVNIQVQMQINATKYQQSDGFRASINQAMELGSTFNDGGGAATIIEDTASIGNAPSIENKWGTGPRGEGTNRLGNSQTAFANMLMQSPQYKNSLLQQNAELPQFDQFKAATGPYYDQANNQFTNGVQIALKEVRKYCSNTTKQPDTSELPGVINYADTNAVKSGLGAANNMQTAAAGVGGLTPQQPNGLLKYQSNKGDYQVVKRDANAAIELHIKKDGSIEPWFKNNNKWEPVKGNYRDNVKALISQYQAELQQAQQQKYQQQPQQPQKPANTGGTNIDNAYAAAQQKPAAVLPQYPPNTRQPQQPATGLPQYPPNMRQPQQPTAGLPLNPPNSRGQAQYTRLQNAAHANGKPTSLSDGSAHNKASEFAQKYIDAINKVDNPKDVLKINSEASKEITKLATELQNKYPKSNAAAIISSYFDTVARAANDRLDDIQSKNTVRPK